MYGYAFNPARRSGAAGPGDRRALAWLERASLPVSQLSDPLVIRAALDGLCARLDGSRAAANTITRKRAVFHGALGYAVEARAAARQPRRPDQLAGPQSRPAVNPATVASPAQVGAMLGAVARIRPELAAFFGCLYYAALRPEEAVALRRDDSSCPAAAAGRSSSPPPARAPGPPGPARDAVMSSAASSTAPTAPSGWSPSRPSWSAMLRPTACHGTAPDGRLFRGTRGGLLSESVYGRAWHAARHAALGPELAATALARRPYDLRHAALSLWLNATGPPAEVAARAGNSARVLLSVYLHCTDGQDGRAAS